MFILMVVIFIVGYAAIALEHPIKIDKAASALLTGVLCWVVLIMGSGSIFNIDFGQSVSDFISNAGSYPANIAGFLKHYSPKEGESVLAVSQHFIGEELLEHLAEIAGILFFLLGAMTIVELVDAHEGFRIITDKVETTKRVTLLWIVGIITFFLSATLDNLTTSIVMAALLKKLMKEKEDLWKFAGVVVIAANAGGAWSPIGDVTTIMLWIGGQVTTWNIIMKTFIPSLVCLLAPLLFLSFSMKGKVTRPLGMLEKEHLVNPTTDFERVFIFCLGVGVLLFVPVFKTITHLPPYMGILFGLSILWITTEIMHSAKNKEERTKLSVIGVLRKVDTPSVLFFLGILTAVASLQTAGHLTALAHWLQNSIGNMYAINIIIGFLSSIVDNVPLVAGAMGMYELAPYVPGVAYPPDDPFWEFLAYCAGTGGSCLIIGSAAGVAIMGILKIDFIWYMKKISILAAIGYLAGAATFILMNEFLFHD